MCTSYRLWELEYGTDLWLEQSSLGKLLWNVYTILYMYLQAHVLPTNKSSLFMFIITSIPCIVLKTFFLTLCIHSTATFTKNSAPATYLYRISQSSSRNVNSQRLQLVHMLVL